jgi:hypothetical protein
MCTCVATKYRIAISLAINTHRRTIYYDGRDGQGLLQEEELL